MVEGAALEMLFTGNRNVGSNPTLSAYWSFDMSIYESKEWKVHLKKFVNLIKNESVDIDSYIMEIVSWLSNPKLKRFEPYCALYRNALDADKDGKCAKPLLWKDTFIKIEKIHDACMYYGSPWARVISSETISHRWFDFDFHLGMSEYRDRWILGYDTSYNISLKLFPYDKRYLKFLDSSLYWKANAFYKIGDPEKAKEIFCKIANRDGKRYGISDAFLRKIRVSDEICRGVRDIFHINKDGNNHEL